MKVRNKITGVISTERRDIAQALIRQGMCEEISESYQSRLASENPPAPPDMPQWAVTLLETATKQVLSVTLRIGGQNLSYFGPASTINAKKTWPGRDGQTFCNYFNGFGREVPAHIVTEYTKRLEVEVKKMLNNQAHLLHESTVYDLAVEKARAQNKTCAADKAFGKSIVETPAGFIPRESEDEAVAKQAEAGFAIPVDYHAGADTVTYEKSDPASFVESTLAKAAKLMKIGS